MKQAMSYLGLGPDDSYALPQERSAGGDASPPEHQFEPTTSGVTILERPTGTMTKPASAVPAGHAPRRPAAFNSKPFVLQPRMFDDAQQLGDRFKHDQAIILNLQGLDRDTARRLLDFASGLCYARDGEMRKVAGSVYMLVPANVVVSDDQSYAFGASGGSPSPAG